MKKLKIKPSMKIHRRYLLLQAKSKDEVERVILDYLGILGFAKASPIFVEDKTKGSKKNKNLILAIDRKEINNIRGAFTLSNKVKTLKVSGTIKSLKD